jgi:hypothetical protein
MQTYKLNTHLIVSNERLPDDFKPTSFELEGTPEELIYKMYRQTVAVVAKHESDDTGVDFETLLKQYLKKYAINTPQ